MNDKFNYFWRIYFFIFILSLGFSVLAWRIIYLGTTKREFLTKQSDARSLRVVNIKAHRGIIMDRNGVLLAISTPVKALWASPQIYHATNEQESELSNLLGIKINALHKKINNKKEFVYLKRRISSNKAAKIKNLKIPGIFVQQEYQRYYPEGEITSQLLGFTDIDDQGAEGIELAYDQWLRGVNGKKEVAQDRIGNIIDELRVISEPLDGRNLVLSIDRNIQYLAYKELSNAVAQNEAEAGTAVVLDSTNGEVLAMVNYPSYDPNNRPKKRSNVFRNRAITDLFEPGSVIKTFSILTALESNKYKPWTKVDTNPGWLQIGNNRVTDPHGSCGVITLTEILQKSSNVGITKVILSLPYNSLLNLLERVGFGSATYSGFPGEAIGSLPSNLNNRPFMIATLAFGYRMSVTAAQLAKAYSVIAAKGILRPITFLKTDTTPSGEQVIKKSLVSQTTLMLETVLKTGGTGTRGKVSGYRVAGKTGTAGIAGRGGYDKSHYNSIFVGLAPVTSPKLVVVVVVKNPKGITHYGGSVAGPAFSNIMSGALRILNVQPDNFEPENKGLPTNATPSQAYAPAQKNQINE